MAGSFKMYTSVNLTAGITARMDEWGLEYARIFTEGFFAKQNDRNDWDADRLNASLDKWVTAEFTGIVCLDWEAPFPILEDPADPSHATIKARYVAMIEHCKAQRPNAQFGYYGIPFTHYWPIYLGLQGGGVATDYANQQATYSDIYAVSDVLLPHVYDYYIGDAPDLVIFKELIRVSLVEAAKQTPDLPVVCLTWDRYHDGGSSNPRRFETMPEEEYKEMTRSLLRVAVSSKRLTGIWVWGADEWHYGVASGKNSSGQYTNNTAWAQNLRRVFSLEASGYSNVSDYIEQKKITTFERVNDVMLEFSAPLFDNRKNIMISASTGFGIANHFAVMRALFDPSFNIHAILSSHYASAPSAGFNTAFLSQTQNAEVVRAAGLSSDVPVLLGSNFALADAVTPISSDASSQIVSIANELPLGGRLDIIVTGSLTDVASAILQDPEIVERLRVHFLGTTWDGTNFSENEFNANHDQHALTAILASGVEFIVMDSNASGQLVLQSTDIDTLTDDASVPQKYLDDKYFAYLDSISSPGSTQWQMYPLALVESVANPSLATKASASTASLTDTNPHTARTITTFSDIDQSAIEDVFWNIMAGAQQYVSDEEEGVVVPEPPAVGAVLQPIGKPISPTLAVVEVTPQWGHGKMAIVVTENNSSLPALDDGAWKANIKGGRDHAGADGVYASEVDVTSLSRIKFEVSGLARGVEYFAQALQHNADDTAEVIPPVVTDGQMLVKEGFPRLWACEIAGASRLNDFSYRASLVKHDAVVIGLWRGWQSSSGESFVEVAKDLKSRALAAGNTEFRLGKYTNVMQSYPPGTDAAQSDRADKYSAQNWWMLDAANKPTSQWPGRQSVNITRFVALDADGLTAAQWTADRNYALFFNNDYVDFVFGDDTHDTPRHVTDMNDDGVNEPRITDSINAPVIPENAKWYASAYRQGHRDYIDRLRVKRPGIPVIVNNPPNTDDNMGNMQAPEYRGACDGVFEGMYGFHWSRETWGNAVDALKAYQNYFKPGRLRSGFLGVICGGNQTDYRQLRYCLTSTLIFGDAYFYYSHPGSSDTKINDSNFHQGQTLQGGHYASSWWYDEYDIQLGRALEAPPLAGSSNLSGGLYKRVFEGGIAIVNLKGNAAQFVSIPSGYKRFLGQQDSSHNNGSSQSLTLQPRDGIVLVKI